MSSSSVWGGGRTVGRGPSGRVRNMQAMKDAKLIAVERLLTDDGHDSEALARCRAEMRRRGFPVGVYQGAGSGAQAAMVTSYSGYDTVVPAAAVQDEYDELLDWLAEVTN